MERSPEVLGDESAWPSTSNGAARSSVWEIEEEEEEVEEETMTNGVSNERRRTDGDDEVYVAVGKRSSSMEALSWALKHVAKPSSLVYLVHVFPEVHQIPSPLGMLPKSQANAQQVETYMNRERKQRRDMLQKFMNLCHSSKVDVDTILIESDLIAKAIVDLIPVLNIKKLIVGTTKSSMRKLKKGNSKAEQIQRSAPHYCEVKIICDGREVTATDGAILSSSLSDETVEKTKNNSEIHRNKNSISCNCFPSKFM